MITSVFTPFRVVLLFLLIAVAGLLVLPKLTVDLLPQEKNTQLKISFSLSGSSPEIVEQQVTAVIEGACSQLSQLKKISSVSNYNNGYVQLQFDKSVDIEFKQFEVAAIIRQVYPRLPVAASYPIIFGGNSNVENQQPLLVFSINAPLQPFRIRQQSEDIFRKAFAGMQGIKEINVSGSENLQLSICFDKNKCENWQVSPQKIISSLQSYFGAAWPGKVLMENGEQYFLHLPTPTASIETIENILLPVTNSQPIRLKDIAQVYIEEQLPNGYFRMNGKNSVNLNLYAREGENKIVLGKKAKQLIDKVKTQLPKDFEVSLEYDDTDFLEKEINKNYQRAGLSAGILILFIFVAYRSTRYLLILFSGLIVSFCITIILAWLFKVNIHLYTIAGIAICFGIMMDNAIVMLDYYHQWRNRKVFLALLASSLTTIAALSLVFFLPDEEKKNLLDFSIIIVLALIASLITALWFTPGLYNLTTGFLKKPGNRFLNKKRASNYIFNRRQVKITNGYFLFISWIAGYRKTFILLVLLGFGLPVFMLPTKLQGNSWYHDFYNASIGSDKYQENIKPITDKLLGGVLRLFVNNVYEKSGYRSPEKTKLYITAELPYGNTIGQLNFILADFEKYLSTIDGIDKYITSIYSGQNGAVEISFKETFEKSALPYQLKSRLIARSLDWSGVQWNVYGVGQGFSNVGSEEIPNFRVSMKGYNYDELEKQANLLAAKLSLHKRIQKINTNERLNYGEKKSMEYVLNLDAEKMALHNTNQSEILSKINNLSQPNSSSAQITIDNLFYPVMLKEKQSENYSVFDLLKHAIQLDTSRAVRIEDLGQLEFRNTANSVHKEDRQYIRKVGFEYMGSSQFGVSYLDKVLKEMKETMPVGYSAVYEGGGWYWGSNNRNYMLIAVLLISIFFICSVLFENLKEPLFIISMIPISFIGLFMVFAVGNFYFDQGGYAAFVMLGGLVSNAAIFIINDFNNLKKKKPAVLYNRLLIKATANRSRTILLTTVSTCCGLIPFLIEGQNEVFWFSLAAGTIAGLVFSLFAVLMVLPVLCWKNIKKIKNKSSAYN